jgi:alkylation response protein AidB-like acyl-CoA dehydrogenase
VGRIKLAAACLDASRRITTEGIKYANERVQFKTPISSFGAIQYKVAEMATKTFVSESGSYRAAKDIQNQIDEFTAAGKSHQEAELEGVEQYAIECAMLKVYASEAVQYISDEGIQILGGMGFSKETPMESAWRDARIGRIYEGTNEINRLLSVGMLLKKALKGEVDLMSPAMGIAGELMSIPSFDTPDYSAPMSEEKEMVEKLKKTFLMVAGKAVEHYGMELEQQQQLILAAADIMMEVYMAESTVLRAEKMHLNGDANASYAAAMAKLNLAEAVDKVKKSGREAICGFAEGDDQRLLLMGLKRFTKYTNEPNTIALRKEISAKLIEENNYCF